MICAIDVQSLDNNQFKLSLRKLLLYPTELPGLLDLNQAYYTAVYKSFARNLTHFISAFINLTGNGRGVQLRHRHPFYTSSITKSISTKGLDHGQAVY